MNTDTGNKCTTAAMNTLIKIGYVWNGGELWEPIKTRLLCVCNEHGCDIPKCAACPSFEAGNKVFPDLDCKHCGHTVFCHEDNQQALKMEIERLRQNLTTFEKAFCMKNDGIAAQRRKIAEVKR